MALATRCPHCETVFRLDPQLLAPHDGRVRCGHCQEVFDAAHHQLELVEQESAAAPPAPDFGSNAWDPWAPLSRPLGADPSIGVPVKPFVAPGALAPEADREVELPAHEPDPAVGFEPLSANPGVKPVVREDPAPAVPFSERFTRARALASTEPDAFAAQPVAADAARESSAEPAVRPIGKTPDPVATAASDAPVEARHSHGTAPSPFGVNEDERLEEQARARRTEPFIAQPDGERVEPGLGTKPAWRAGASAPATAFPPTADPDATQTRDTGNTEPRFATPPPGAGLPPAAAAGAAEPFPVMRETRSPQRSRAILRAVGIVVAVLLAIALIVQIVWWQRESVMVFFPRAQSMYAQVCDQLGCSVAPPRDIDGLQIENSGLRQIDGSHRLELKLSLRNRFDVTLAYPALELSLLDDTNRVTIRRVLWPQDYARPGTAIGAGIAARTAQTVVVRLDTGDAVAANYRVQIFYP
jgi:predicted Zn finger-like uncharacterized protein